MQTVVMLLWLGLAVILGIVEAFTLGLTSIWFAGGAVAAAACSLFIDSIWCQFVIFIIISAILLIFTRPVVSKHLNNKIVKTNISALVGEKALVLSDISAASPGEARVDGKVWMAEMEKTGVTYKAEKPDGDLGVTQPESGFVFKAGTYVTVKGIEGVRLIVGID